MRGPAPYREVCADALDLLWAVLDADEVALWARADAPQLVLVAGRDDGAPSGTESTPPAPPWPVQPTYSSDSGTLLLPCVDGAGRVVALAHATGVRRRRLPPVSGLTAVGGVLARTVAEIACAAGPWPGEEAGA